MEGVFEVNGSGKRLLHCENPLPEFLIGPQKFISGCFDFFFFFFFRKQEANLSFESENGGEEVSSRPTGHRNTQSGQTDLSPYLSSSLGPRAISSD